MGYIKVYTEKIIEDKYPASLAHSVHFSCKKDGEDYITLNQGYGVLFAKAEIRENNTIAERGVINPFIICAADEYIVGAMLTDAEGNVIDNKFIIWKTKDFVTFSEQEKIGYSRLEQIFTNNNTNENLGSLYERLAYMSEIELSNGEVDIISEAWTPIHSTGIEMPPSPHLGNISELDKVCATVLYSDKTKAKRKVNWDYDSLIDMGNGKYKIRGEVVPTLTGFPLAPGFADPIIFKWEGKWYFLATNDNTEDVGMYVREADTVEQLFDEDIQVHCILPYDEARGFCQTFWAPEFHVLNGDLYILFAVSGKQWGPQCHMMKLKKGGSIINENDWENPLMVVKKDGTPIAMGNISLDMTVIKNNVNTYVCWSHRENIGTTLDSGSMLYIATIDEKEPWKLTSEPILLSRPLYGWENNSGTINNEGPYALTIGEAIYLAFSGGAANGYYYVVGYLVANVNSDLLDVHNWQKLPMPVMHSLSIPGIQGPGHNSFWKNDDGELMIAYHAQERDKYNCRCSAYHHVHLGADGFPHLNVVDELDVNPAIRAVEIVFSIKNT